MKGRNKAISTERCKWWINNQKIFWGSRPFKTESLQMLISPSILTNKKPNQTNQPKPKQQKLRTIINTNSEYFFLESYQKVSYKLWFKCKVLKYPSARTSFLPHRQLCRCIHRMSQCWDCSYEAQSSTKTNAKYSNRNNQIEMSSLFFRRDFLGSWWWI